MATSSAERSSIPSVEARRRYRWMLVLSALGGLEIGLLLLDISPVLLLVRQRFGVSYVDAGWAVSATIIAHTCTLAVASMIVGRVGSRRLLLTGTSLLAVSAVVRGLAPTFAVLIISRVITGLGTGAVGIAGLTAISLLSPAEHQIRDQGLFGAIQQFGVMLTLLIAPLIVPTLGPLAFWGGLAAILVLLLVLGAIYFPRIPSEALRPAEPVKARVVLFDKYGWLLTLTNMAGYGVFVGVTSWMATFLVERYHTPASTTALLAGGVTFFAFVGRMAAGALARLLGVRHMIIGFILATGGSIALAPLAPTVWGSAILLMIFSCSSSAPFGAVFGSAPDRPAPGGLAQRFMLIMVCSNLMALTLPPLIGYTVHVTGGFFVGFWLITGFTGAVALVLWRSMLGRVRERPGVLDQVSGARG
jgi:nitrate/nitrite transporter NarK